MGPSPDGLANVSRRITSILTAPLFQQRLSTTGQWIGTRNVSSIEERKYIPRRALMYVPGNDERKLAKISGLDLDCVVLDCEDGVALNKKKEARETIRKVLDTGSIAFGRTECTVRVNSIESGFCEDDLEVILKAKKLPSAINIPKVENAKQLKWFIEKAEKLLANRNFNEQIRLILFIESAKSLLSLREICEGAIEMTKMSSFVPDALVFGSDDFCADIGATRTNIADEVLFARQFLVTVAKAYKLQAIDVVYIEYKDLEGLRNQALAGARMGFTGKQLIHPGQIQVCQESFSPSNEKIEWARELLKEFEEHQKSGKGAFNFRGSMIDMPLVLQAKNVMTFSNLVKNK